MAHPKARRVSTCDSLDRSIKEIRERKKELVRNVDQLLSEDASPELSGRPGAPGRPHQPPAPTFSSFVPDPVVQERKKRSRLLMSRSLSRLNLRLRAVRSIQAWWRRHRVMRLWYSAYSELMPRRLNNRKSSGSCDQAPGVARAKAYVQGYIVRAIYRSVEAVALRAKMYDVQAMLKEVRDGSGDKNHQAAFEKQLLEQAKKIRLKFGRLFHPENRKSLTTLLRKRPANPPEHVSSSVVSPQAAEFPRVGLVRGLETQLPKQEMNRISPRNRSRSPRLSPVTDSDMDGFQQKRPKSSACGSSPVSPKRSPTVKTDISVRFEPRDIGLEIDASNACILSVDSGSQAETKGVLVGWLITELNGRKIRPLTRLASMVQKQIHSSSRAFTIGFKKSPGPKPISSLRDGGHHKPPFSSPLKAKGDEGEKDVAFRNPSPVSEEREIISDSSRQKKRAFLRRKTKSVKVSQQKLKWAAKPRTVCKLENRYKVSKGRSRRRAEAKKSGKLDLSKIKSRVNSRWSSKPEEDDDSSESIPHIKMPATTTPLAPGSDAPQEIRGRRDAFFISVSDYRRAMSTDTADGTIEALRVEEIDKPGDLHVRRIRKPGHEGGEVKDQTRKNKRYQQDTDSGDQEVLHSVWLDNRRRLRANRGNRKLHHMSCMVDDIQQTLELIVGTEEYIHVFDAPVVDTRIPHIGMDDKLLRRLLGQQSFREELRTMLESLGDLSKHR
ncbi:hypothetical protein AAMO2058_001750600 [Amorphochlora amoebiformis]